MSILVIFDGINTNYSNNTTFEMQIIKGMSAFYSISHLRDIMDSFSIHIKAAVFD